ncbi:single-stranded-DNA-specific exonuclease RecJ [bacterium]|nr:single-stranded-DNA-specific exonuclease RecJ [bacterium]
MPKNWLIKEHLEPDKALVDSVGSVLLAKLLMQRGISTSQKAKVFLNPSKIEPISPYAYRDMEKAVARIKKAIDEKQHIVICGDFDADGVTSTAVMHKTLEHLGATFSHYIPDRQTESHGLSSAVLLKKISKEQAKLFITVDCAISDIDEVALVNSFGADVIITDHHEPKDVLPKAYAILDAKAEGSLQDNLSLDDINSLSSMAGVGVAFKLSCALLDEYGKIDFTKELLPLVALGTVADIMPLLYENRLFVYLGMKLIEDGKNKGLTALLKAAGANTNESLTAEKVAFTLAPRINAAGRLDNAEVAFKLLTSNDDVELAMISQTLNNYNKIRQELGDKTFDEAVEYIEKNGLVNDSALIAYNPEWHIGIIGIVASRIAEKYNKPTFMFTDSPDGEKYRASIRSVEGINIFNVLEMNSDIITSYGGHSMAAGLALNKTDITLEKFREVINSTVFEMTGGEVQKPVLNIDLEVNIEDLNLELLDTLKKLEPCGVGNELPLFAIKNLTLQTQRVVGQSGNHLKFNCSDRNYNTVDCVFWNHSSLNVPTGKTLDIAFYPKLNEFNGNRTLQLDVQDYNSDFLIEECKESFKIIDHRNKTNILPQVEDYISTSSKQFKIFVEDKAILDELSGYEEIKKNVITRLTLEKADQLMFFDYPSDKKLLEFIISSVKPRVIHFMNYKMQSPDIDAMISKVSGMLKYAVKKYDGVVYLPNISAALSITDELTTLIVKLLNRTNVIKVNDFVDGNIHFDFIEAVSVDIIKSHEVYEKCRMELFKAKNFREKIISATDLSEIVR